MARSQIEKQLAELEKLRQRGKLTDDEYQSRRQAILADTASKGSGPFKWGLLGCLGIFAAIAIALTILIVVLGAAMDSSGDDTPDTGGDVRVTLEPGASGEIAPERNGSKRVKVTILQIVDGAESTNQFLSPTEGKKYWAVEVEVENVGTSEVSSPDWKLRDTTDVEHDRTFFQGVGENLDVSFDLTPGGKLQGWVVFEIDLDAGPKWLRADPNVFLANDLYFDAP